MTADDRPTAIKVFFDARWTRTDHHDGISRYGSHLVEALSELTDVTMLVHDERQLDLLPRDVPHVLVNHPLAARELLLPRLLNRMGADVVFSPMQVMGTLGRRYKLIFTLHDTIYYRYPSSPHHLPGVQRGAWWLFHQAYWPGRIVLNQADAIATVSQTSKHEIVSYHLTDRPVAVVANAAPRLDASPHPTDVTPDLVFMGTLMPYKNVETLIRSLPLLPDHRLHLTGRGSEERVRALKALATENGVEDRVVFWNGATDAQYAELLSTATASVSASKAEGFGLPLIEAMASGVPFIGSDMPIFREVGGDAILYFDSDSPEQFAARVREVEDPEVRARLAERGRARAAAYSWEHSAQQLYEVIRTLAADRAGTPRRRDGVAPRGELSRP